MTWTSNSYNVLTAINFDAGVLPYFSKIKFTCSELTEGASFRVIVVTKNDENENVNFIKSVTTTGEIEISINELIQQWGANTMTEEQLAQATQLRIGGGSDGTYPASLTIDPTTICLETTWESPMEIGSTADWSGFSLLVKNGLPSLNATMTTDVNAGSTMVGTSTKPYQGTFDGAGHTLTFTYDGSTSNEIAPFQYINNATINNLTTAGSINAQNIFGGIVGTAGGASTLNYCTSNMVLTANDNGDSNNGRVAGLVGRCADNATPVGTSITFNNCVFSGSISSTIGSRCCGLVSWARSTTVTANNCLIAPTSVTNGAANIAATGGTDPVVTPTNCYYTIQFGGSGQGTSATAAQVASGELCYALNENTVPSTTYFFGQDLKAVSSSPMLTSNAAYKVYSLGDGEYANTINTIGNTEDWVLFSKLVASGETDLDVTMTADVDAGSTMVGSESKKYSGTFDGAGHTLTFNYDGNGNLIAPFKEVDGATIKDLKTTGSITSSANLLGGIVGQVNGATTLTRCASDMSITTTVDTNGRIGGLVARNGQTGSSLTFNNCMYNGAISSSTNQAAGFVGWSPNATTISNCLVASTSVSGGESNFSSYTFTVPEGKYALYISKFGSSTQGTQITDAQRYNGYVAYTLSSDISEGTLFFGQGGLNSSRVDNYPTLTSDASKKVYKASNESLYANSDGLLPDPALSGKLSWKMAMTWAPIYFVTLPAASASSFELYGSADAYILKVSSAGATTLVVPFNVAEANIPAGVKVYDLTCDGADITATRVNEITANKPVLINAEAGEYILISNIDPFGTLNFSTYTETTNGALTGVYNTSLPFSYVPKDAYVLQNGADGLGFYKVETANTIMITSFRAYLTASAGARSLRIIYNDNEETTISEISNVKNDNANVFNLNGQRVKKAANGLYIKNGKKVIVK